MVISLPSLDGIKRAVEMKLGVALLPRRCAITEIASGRLVARAGGRRLAPAPGDARLPQGAPLARGGCVSGGGAGKQGADVSSSSDG